MAINARAQVGTTAISALLLGDSVYVSWIGDSRGVLLGVQTRINTCMLLQIPVYGKRILPDMPLQILHITGRNVCSWRGFSLAVD